MRERATTISGHGLRGGLAARGLHLTRDGTIVLRGVDLDVPTGATVALLGPSDAGKSALLRVLAGVEAPDAGTVDGGRPAFVAAGAGAPALAAALDGDAAVLLLDEPFAGLDGDGRAALRLRLRDRTVVIATHEREEALAVADRVVVLHEGRVVQQGPADELYDAPASPLVMAALGPVARFGDGYVRPHDVDIHLEPVDGAVEAQIADVARVGFEVRVEAELGDGARVAAAVTRQEAAELELAPGEIVWLRPHAIRTFPPGV